MSTTTTTDHDSRACHFCGTVCARALSAPHWQDDAWHRIRVCDDPACRDLIASRPRRPRRPRTEPAMVDAGGWAMIPGLNRMMAEGQQ